MRKKRRKRSKILKAKVVELLPGGGAVATHEGNRYHVDRGLVGDEVEMRPESRRGGLPGGRVITIADAPGRRTPECGLFGDCGGCSWMKLEPSDAKKQKVSFLSHAIEGLHDGVEVEWVSAESTSYRRRARLFYSGNTLGYRRAKSDELIDVETCVVLERGLDDALKQIRARVLPSLEGAGTLYLASSTHPELGQGVVGLLATRRGQNKSVYDAFQTLVDDQVLHGVTLDIDGVAAHFGDPDEWVDGGDKDTPLLVGQGGFSQANRLNNVLRERVVHAAFGRVLELYAGHGNLSVALAQKCDALTCVELESGAVDALRQNIQTRNLKTKCVVADAAQFMSKFSAPIDCLVLDPPRAGARGVVRRVAKLPRAPSRIIYVSCDTLTLRRDLRELGNVGYRVAEAAAFDFFPHTAHVESFVVLDRASD